MPEPTVAGIKPKITELEKGKTYAWCACGDSKDQPFCDGSHQKTEFKPVVFKAEGGKVALCMCKKTKGAPFCDGSHTSL
ncbi:CDGSH iron-sulfur domain-containing protein [bacterium]|nr:CDGSH iron-sulfur domain-containing protein [bacterium]